MAHTPPKKKPRRTRIGGACFSGCFGPRRSGEVTEFEARPDDGEKLKISWFHWSRSRFKKSAAKTVPVETSAALVSSTVEAEKKEANDRFNNPPSKSKSKLKSKLDGISSKSRLAKEAKATATATTTVAGTAPPGQPPGGEVERDRETSEHEAEAHRHDTRENRTDSPRGNTWHHQKRLSFCRKIDSIRAGSSQPVSPDVKPAKPSRSSAAAAIPHSASVPILHPEPQPAGTVAPPPPRPVQPQKNRRVRQATGPSGEVKGVDPVVGMSIIMVTLVIMLLWGRLCAILCTAVWLYFVPKLRSSKERRVNGEAAGPDGPDLSSEEYKKRVVLEGLLERNRRNPL